MRKKILYIERKLSESVSIEKVFRQIAASLSKIKFQTEFEQVPFDNDTISTFKNLLFYRKSKADIYHITGHVHYVGLILPKERTVLTIHDLRILYMRKGFRRYILKKLLFDLPIAKLKYITAISEETKREIVYHTKCSPEKIRVIQNPLPIRPISEKGESFNTKCPRILQIGTTSNKNLDNLIKALENIECELVIIGRLDSEIRKLLAEKQINFENKINLDDDEIRNEYDKADIVTFCSTYEGFGMPIIEAQAMRTPVVTSNLSPMKEVAGEAAVLVDPYNVSSIEDGILQIIKDEKLRDDLIEKGINNIKRFEPSFIAELYENLYREIIKSENLL